MKRILIVCHGHPELSTGGGEIAAYRQCQALRARGHEVMFMARAASQSGRGGTPFTMRPAGDTGAAGDVLFHSPNADHFLHSQRAKWSVYEKFRELLERFAPDIVHFHHYVHLGVELIREARKYSERMPIVLTLHEYLAICEHHGQMIKTDQRLCNRALPADCHACFPQHSPQDFFLRERFIKSHLNAADAFVCPSRFLLERYAAWGLPREKLHYIENGQPEPAAFTGAELPPADLARRFAFFGQISELKGYQVFFDAIRHLPDALRRRARFAVHGTLQHQPEATRERFQTELAALGGEVAFYGPYRPDDLPTLMRGVGWVVVPSIWWENSPLVIQEAFNHRRPVICSDIGGMAEKVRDGVDGLHFRARDARDLAARIEQASNPRLWTALRDGIAPPVSIDAVTDAQLALFDRIARQRAGDVLPLQRPAASPPNAPRTRARKLAERASA